MLHVAYFKLIAVILLFFGATSVAVPDLWLQLLDVDASPGGDSWGRAFGAMALGFGVLVWVTSGSAEPRTRQATAGAVALTFFTASSVDAALTLNGTYPAALLGWTYSVGNLLLAAIAAYFLIASRRSAAT